MQYINNKWAPFTANQFNNRDERLSDSFFAFDRQMVRRIHRLIEVPARALEDVMGLSSTVFRSLGSVVTLGRVKPASPDHCEATKILSNVVLGLIRTINPNTEYASSSTPPSVTKWLNSKIEGSCFRFEHFTLQNLPVQSRVSCLLTGIAKIVARLIDLVISILATPLVLVTGGTVGRLNDAGYAGLSAPIAIPLEAIKTIIGVFNPHALLVPRGLWLNEYGS